MLVAMLLGVLAGGCAQGEDVRPVPTPVPTTAAPDSPCGMDLASVAAVTGIGVDEARAEFTGSGPDLRGGCSFRAEGYRRAVAHLYVLDGASEGCQERRDILANGEGPMESVPFETLDGGVWGLAEPQDAPEPVSVAFTGGVCLGMRLTAVVEGRDPVQESEALLTQAMTTLGLDG